MAYSEFTLERAINELALDLSEPINLFVSVAPLALPEPLAVILAENIPVALDVSTEKARSELIISPILMEVRKQVDRAVSVFSGSEFNVAPERELNGVCDFILTRSRQQLVVSAPICVIVEAKRGILETGLGQCAAAMVAAQLFNVRSPLHGQPDVPPSPIYGLVTTGSNWRFMRLNGATLFVDLPEYHIESLEKVYSILLSIANGTAP